MRIPKHPGKLIAEELAARNLSAARFAKATLVPANRITEIIRARRDVTADTALRLAAFFGNSPEFWLQLQTNHNIGKARAQMNKRDLDRIKAAA
ncbi:MAG: HigA family addiction module antidote protein [Proteobacteria bacterium]|nr:HigA family addiction module antidote protein [Pseudomonadota bacterium]